MAKLKVYGGNDFEVVNGRRKQVRVIVAATSQKAAAEAVGISLSALRSDWSETWNDLELETAMSAPGVVFHTSGTGSEKDYRPRSDGQGS